MTTACLAMLLLATFAGPTRAAGPQTLQNGSWLCSTPAAYDHAVAEERKWQGTDLQRLKDQLLEKKLCMYIDSEYLEDMMAPYVKVLTRQGDRVKVSFTVEFYKRIEFLHRRITRVTFSGWTDAGNLRDF
ncbi:MAG: hypothetical protein ACE5MG_03980 [Candidatus Methylomirabilales bacterium]